MKRTLLIICLQAMGSAMVFAQNVKHIEHITQAWLGYFNQTRFSNRWGLWSDVHLRTKENFASDFSQSIIRMGLTYYLNDNTKLMAAYGRIYIFPGDNHKGIIQPEHRPWQQIQWHTAFTKTRMMQWIRLDERFRRKILNDSTLGNGYNFNWRLRYNIWYEIPLYRNGTAPNSISFIANDELHINFGKEIVNNYFDQNRLFFGFKYQLSKTSNIQGGYSNVFQQLAAGNAFKNINLARVFFFQNFDLRNKMNKR